jgi:hypothetical protein
MKKTIKSNKKAKLIRFKELRPGDFFTFDANVEEMFDAENDEDFGFGLCLKLNQEGVYVYPLEGAEEEYEDNSNCPVYRLKYKLSLSCPERDEKKEKEIYEIGNGNDD